MLAPNGDVNVSEHSSTNSLTPRLTPGYLAASIQTVVVTVRNIAKIAALTLAIGRVGVGDAIADAPSASPQATIDPGAAVAVTSVVEGPGFKLGESNVMHPAIGAEMGFISNVFYEDTDTVSSGLLRLAAVVGVGSLSGQRLQSLEGDRSSESFNNPGRLQYRLDANLIYDLHLSDNDRVTAQNGLSAGITAAATVNPGRAWSLILSEDFQRTRRPTNFESFANTNRIVNRAGLAVRFQPRGRTLSGTLRYGNTIDYFESDAQGFANRFINTLALRVNWQWLPKTGVFSEVSQSVVTGYGSDSTKTTAFPLETVVGIQTLVTARTALSARLGYQNGFYSSGPSYSAVVAGAQFGFRYSPLGGIGLGYSYHHEDSVNANFYRDHALNLSVAQLFIPFVTYVAADVRFRRYEGITAVMGAPAREDVTTSLSAGIRYNFRDWLATTADYTLSLIQTDYMYTTPDGYTLDPSFVRHMLLVGLRAAF